ncbi:MAG: hypothetical protein DSZ12_06485 [Sulfurovum sp.]|nr:MAG: hypothetical protein DSZ12_06485 [Sulfurovum sp.]
MHDNCVFTLLLYYNVQKQTQVLVLPVSEHTANQERKKKQEEKQYGKMKTHKLPDKMIQRFSAQRALFTCTNMAENAACSSLETGVSVSTNQWLRYVLPKVWFHQNSPVTI